MKFIINDRRKSSLLNVVSMVAIVLSITISFSSIVMYSNERIVLAEKYNTKMKSDYTKFLKDREEESDRKFYQIQTYILNNQQTNTTRIEKLEKRLDTLEMRNK